MSKVNFFKPEDFQCTMAITSAEIARVANAKLESAPVVYGQNDRPNIIWLNSKADDDTHTARLVCIEPIVQESAEDLLRELIANADQTLTSAHILNVAFDVAKRARALLAKGEK